jgi:hypothetical protein
MNDSFRPATESSGPQTENTCSYCLYFEQWRASRRKKCGNCSLHKEWVEDAALMTCSDMSMERLGNKGIYRLVEDGGVWGYVRRERKVRTRLFVVGGRRGLGTAKGRCNKEGKSLS